MKPGRKEDTSLNGQSEKKIDMVYVCFRISKKGSIIFLSDRFPLIIASLIISSKGHIAKNYVEYSPKDSLTGR